MKSGIWTVWSESIEYVLQFQNIKKEISLCKIKMPVHWCVQDKDPKMLLHKEKAYHNIQYHLYLSSLRNWSDGVGPLWSNTEFSSFVYLPVDK